MNGKLRGRESSNKLQRGNANAIRMHVLFVASTPETSPSFPVLPPAVALLLSSRMSSTASLPVTHLSALRVPCISPYAQMYHGPGNIMGMAARCWLLML